MTPENRPRRRGQKPQASAEVARVLRIFEMLYGEFRPTNDSLPHSDRLSILAVAERIAARTEGL